MNLVGLGYFIVGAVLSAMGFWLLLNVLLSLSLVLWKSRFALFCSPDFCNFDPNFFYCYFHIIPITFESPKTVNRLSMDDFDIITGVTKTSHIVR